MELTNIKNYIKRHKFLYIFILSFYRIRILFRIIRKQLFKFVDKEIDNHNLMINVGGGAFFRRHWRVLDFPTPNYNYYRSIIDYKFDLTDNKPFPFLNNTVSFFYISHTLEHIPQEFCQHIFNEIYRCLKNQGAVRITGPDLDLAYEAFGKDNVNFFAKYPGSSIEEKFLQYFATYIKNKVLPKDLQKNYKLMNKEKFCNFYTQQIPRDSQKKFTGNHINWWNHDKAFKMLIGAGFKNIYHSTSQKSRFSEMRGIGYNSGFDSTHPELSFFIEAIKKMKKKNC